VTAEPSQGCWPSDLERGEEEYPQGGGSFVSIDVTGALQRRIVPDDGSWGGCEGRGAQALEHDTALLAALGTTVVV
jgi:hypothetical protein